MKIFLFLLLNCLSGQLVAQDFEITTYLKSNYGNISDSIIAEQVLDSMIQRNGEFGSLNLYFCKVYHAPDSNFVIFQIEGESCGAYCNPFFEVYYGLFNSKIEQYEFYENEISLAYQIEKIIKIADANYLVLGTGYGRSRSVESVWGENATLLHLTDKIQAVWKLSAYTSTSVDLEHPVAEINYDNVTQIIDYQYDWYDEMKDFEVYRISGKWQFDGQIFVEIE